MPADPNRTLRRLVAVLVVIFVVAALKATKPVTMPLAFALFTVVLFWPLYRRLDQRVPTGVALVLTLLAVLTVLGAFVGVIWFTVDEVIEGSSQYRDEFASLRAAVSSFFGVLNGSSAPEASGGGTLSQDRLVSVIERIAVDVWSVLGYLVLTIALFTLAIVEVGGWKHKLRTRFDDPVSSTALGTAEEIAGQVRRFLLVQSFTALMTGILTGILCLILGIDFALLWGLLSFVLNFIPTLGSLVAVVPPTLFALLQYGLGWEAPVLLGGLGLIEITLGAYVDPKLQGRYLELSAFVVLVAIVFWGWLWGIPGAFIAVPITAAFVLTSKHVEGAEWVARLLTRNVEDQPALRSKGTS